MYSTPLLKLLLIAGLLSAYACQQDSEQVMPANDDVIERGAQISQSDVYSFSGGVTGTSKLVRKPNSISATLQTSELVGGDAYTVWFVVFNEPSECGTSPCSEADVFNPAVRADVVYGTGNITGNGDQANFAAALNEGDNSGSIMGFFNSLFGIDLPSQGLEDADQAEIHLIVRSHGPAYSEYMPDMINTFNGGCIYPDNVPQDYGIEGTYACADLQYSVHLP